MRAPVPAVMFLLLFSFGCLSGASGPPEYGGYHEAPSGNESGNPGPVANVSVQGPEPENGTSGQKNNSVVRANSTYGQNDSNALAEKVLPSAGIILPVRWGNIGPATVGSGALNITKFEALLQRNGRPLTEEQRAILENGSTELITIDRNNSYFILNLFWAFGLANDNKILRNFSGIIGSAAVGNLASTGFWSLGGKGGRELFAGSRIIELDGSQQSIVEEVAKNTYRPCCNNPTAFPDCNHGMAALGLAEWMAYQNASEEEIYDALLAANSYWFPQAYVETAAYLEYRNMSWESPGAKEVLSAGYSSYSGYQNTRKGLESFPPVAIAGGVCF